MGRFSGTSSAPGLFGDLGFGRLGFFLGVLLADGRDLSIDAAVAIGFGHGLFCPSYPRRGGTDRLHAVAPAWSERVAITVMTMPALGE